MIVLYRTFQSLPINFNIYFVQSFFSVLVFFQFFFTIFWFILAYNIQHKQLVHVCLGVWGSSKNLYVCLQVAISAITKPLYGWRESQTSYS